MASAVPPITVWLTCMKLAFCSGVNIARKAAIDAIMAAESCSGVFIVLRPARALVLNTHSVLPPQPAVGRLGRREEHAVGEGVFERPAHVALEPHERGQHDGGEWRGLAGHARVGKDSLVCPRRIYGLRAPGMGHLLAVAQDAPGYWLPALAPLAALLVFGVLLARERRRA